MVVDFLPSSFTVPFGAGSASAELISGPGRGSGFLFSGTGDQMSLGTFGSAGPLAALGTAELAARLERVLHAMTVDPGRRVSALDLLDTATQDRLVALGNWDVLTSTVPE